MRTSAALLFAAVALAPAASTAAPSFRAPTVRAASRGGSILQYRQTHAGLEVVGAAVAMRYDAAGRLQWASSTARDLPADLDVTAPVDAEHAIAAAFAGPGSGQPAASLDVARHAQLVIWAPPGQGVRTAWKVVLPRDWRLMQTLLVYVDAHDGSILYTENLVKTDRQANVFGQNPVATPDTEQVTLPLPAASTQLDGPDILGRNCIDNHGCIPVDFGGQTINIHMCDFQASAFADGNGDFLYTRPATDLEPQDEFAEVSMYWHSTHVYEYFRGFGLTNLATHPMSVVANFRVPAFDQTGLCLGNTNDGPLNPFDNAAFIPAGGLTGTFPAEDMLIFGQGTGADMAYEGDVVYHEMGHAVSATVNTMGVVVPDQFGLDTTPGGMQEGYADFFAGTFTEDSKIGEYSGPSFGLPGPIRDMDNNDTCPASLSGEVHQDSLPWTGALWEARTGLDAADHAAFDQAVYDAFTTITETDTMLTTAAKTLDAVESALGATKRAQVEAVLNTRGFDDCDDRVIDTADHPTHGLLQLYGTDQIQAAMVPGPVQWKITLTGQASAITVDIAAAQAGGGGIGGGTEPAVKLLVKKGTDAILWQWSGTTATHDADDFGDVTIDASGGSGEVAGDFAPGTYVVQLANAGGTVIAQGVTFGATAGSGAPDAGTGVDAGGNGEEGSTGGCCDTRSSGGAGGVLVLGLVTLIALRRRRLE
jgi:hypothetical protein